MQWITRFPIKPLLFCIIYINDVPKTSNFDTRYYVDDTALMLRGIKINDFNYKVNNKLIKLEIWLSADKLC